MIRKQLTSPFWIADSVSSVKQNDEENGFGVSGPHDVEYQTSAKLELQGQQVCAVAFTISRSLSLTHSSFLSLFYRQKTCCLNRNRGTRHEWKQREREREREREVERGRESGNGGHKAQGKCSNRLIDQSNGNEDSIAFRVVTCVSKEHDTDNKESVNSSRIERGRRRGAIVTRWPRMTSVGQPI
jgi:hypothetical protein